MKYILFIIVIMGGLLSFNSYARGSCPALQVPFEYDPFLTHFVPLNPSDPKSQQVQALDIHGCTYVIMANDCPPDIDLSKSGSVCIAQQVALLTDDGDTDSPIDNPDTEADKLNPSSENPDIKPDNPDSGSSGSGDGSTYVDADLIDSTSFLSSLQNFNYPFSSNSDILKLVSDIQACNNQAYSAYSHLSKDSPSVAIAYNSALSKCGLIVDSLRTLVAESKVNSPSDDGFQFITKDEYGSVYSCHRNTKDPLDYPSGTYPGPVLGNYISSYPKVPVPKVCNYQGGLPCEESVILNYTGFDYRPNNFCNSVYKADIKERKIESVGTVCPSGTSPTVFPGVCEQDDASALCPPGTFEYFVGYCKLSGNSSGSYHDSGSGDESGSSHPAGDVCEPFGDGCYTSSDHCPFDMHISPGHSSPGSNYCEPDFMPFSGNSASGGDTVFSPGNGHTDSGDGGNGDVVAAINAFHADENKNHQETMKNMNVSDGDVQGIKNGLSSGIHELITSTQRELTDSYNDAMAELKDVFGDIDSYVPDIKLSFDLPTQFTAGIMGRCVPLVFDFNISLVGLPSYHLHAEGIQACKLYDLYVRSIVEYMLYFMTALACRRVFTRAAEFITSQP